MESGFITIGFETTLVDTSILNTSSELGTFGGRPVALAHREPETDPCAATRLAFERYGSSVLLDRLSRNGKAEPGSTSPGREVRLENSLT